MIPFIQGILELHPGAINSIPSKSHIEIGMLYQIFFMVIPSNSFVSSIMQMLKPTLLVSFVLQTLETLMKNEETS